MTTIVNVGCNCTPGTIITDTLTFTAGGLITTTTEDLVLEPKGGKITKIGSSAVTSHNLNANNDLLVGGRLEASGSTFLKSAQYFYGGTTIYGNVSCMNNLIMNTGYVRVNDNGYFILGSSNDTRLQYATTTQTVDTLIMALPTSSRNIIICGTETFSLDYQHAQQTNPTIFLHSAHATDTTQYISFSHNQTHPVIKSGEGVTQFPEGIRTWKSNANVDNPPTDAQLDSAFGTPSEVGDAFIGVVDDEGNGTTLWLCLSDGTNWWFTPSLTKAS